MSACDCDGGVHAAFRSLLRFLLQKKAPKKSKERGGGGENREGSGNHLISIFSDPNQHGAFTRNMGSVDDHVYEPLKITRVPEVKLIFYTFTLFFYEKCSPIFIAYLVNGVFYY